MWYQLMLADFRERTRRYSFLVTLGFVLFWGYLMITGKYTLMLGQCRGIYNSAWVGSVVAIGTTSMIFLFGFFLVKNTIKRDRTTGVGEILAATPVSKSRYLAAKFFSNILTLSLMLLILVAGAVAMQLLAGVTEDFDIWALAAPFLFISLPVVILVSAAAVLFESTRLLRGTLGNVLYFMMAEALMMMGFFVKVPFLDLLGINSVIEHMKNAAHAVYPEAKLGTTMGFVDVVGMEKQKILLFRWDGFDWTTEIFIHKLIWVALAVFLVFIAALLFRRFDPAGEKLVSKSKKTKTQEKKISEEPTQKVHVKDLEPVAWSFNFLALLKAELRVMLKGYHWIWYIVALALVVLPLVLPLGIARQFVLPAAWIWPIALWSSMGTREKRFNTGELFYASPFPLKRQLPAAWVAGVFITLATGSGMIVRSLLAGEMALLITLLISVFFIPTLALGMGAASGSKKLFEIVYMLAWYLGPVNHLTVFNFMGTTAEAAGSGISFVYLGLTALLLPFIYILRKVQAER